LSMKKKFRFLSIIGIISLFMLAACGSGDSADSGSSEGGGDEGSSDVKFLSILTGGTQGTYYPLGGSFAEFISEETGIKTTAESSQASAANMTALADDTAEIAFVQTDIAYYANKGELMFDGQAIDNVSALGALYPETIQLV